MKKKKKKMDKSNHTVHPAAASASASASACGGGEVRRVHIIYFLSWRGRMEHPHLIRLHHYPSSNGGIRLHDVKRWVSAVRRKDMPQLFSWSYKRRYKKGYVWQDLVDQDLITPICDNQYILKGSQIPSPPFNFDEEEAWPPNSMASSSSSSSSESTSTATLTDDSLKLLQDHRNNHSHYYTNYNIKHEEPTAQEHQDSSSCSPLVLSPKEEQGDKMENPSVYSTPSNKNKNKNKEDDENPRVRKGLRSYSSNMFRSLITCGAVNTNDSAMVKIKKRDKEVTSSSCMAMVKLPEDRVSTLNAAAKIPNAGSSWAQRDQRQHSNARRKSCEGQEGRKLNNQMPVSAAYRPINGPKCSQCGKMFKPEKMHKHMESCRGMKSLAKGSGPAAADKPRRSVEGSYQPFSGY